MKIQEKTIKVYYGLKWVKFKPITKEYLYRNMVDLFKAHNNIVDHWES